MNIVLPYKDKLYRFALSIVGNSFDAEDILQEVLIKVWKKWDYFKELDNKEAWCMTVTRNMSIDKLRAGKRKATSDIDDFHHISDAAPSPETTLVAQDGLSKILDIINELPTVQKDVVHLRDIEGYTYKEISEILGISVDQVKVNLHRARKVLKTKLAHMRIK
jgi:RNA polymerase sigma factor (sigma-70 family)